MTEGFYFRNPNNRANIYSLDDGATLLIGDVLDARDGIADGSAHCPTVRVMNHVPDQAALAQVFADPHCFSFQETIRGGFTPQFGGVVSDRSVVTGVRRLAANGLTWDASASYGAHESDFFFNNTVNASLGPDTPRNFDPGLYRQEEVNLNVDVSYAATDIVNIAGGAEWRDERFDIGAGGRPSWEVGPYAAQGFVSGSNGFPFCLTIPSNWTQDVPARYGGRHPGLGHSWLYPKLDTAPPATHPRDAPAATRGMAAEDMRRPRRRPHGRPRSGDEEVAIRGFDSNTRAVRSAGSLREPTDNGGNGPGIGEWKPGNAVGAGSRRPVGWVRTASVGVVSASAAA